MYIVRQNVCVFSNTYIYVWRDWTIAPNRFPRKVLVEKMLPTPQNYTTKNNQMTSLYHENMKQNKTNKV